MYRNDTLQKCFENRGGNDYRDLGHELRNEGRIGPCDFDDPS